MPKDKYVDHVDFGIRLAALRKAAGFTQAELANEIGTSQRVIAYYEKESNYPLAKLFPSLIKALGVSSDELLGIKRKPPPTPSKSDIKLNQQFRLIEQMNTKDKRRIIKLLDISIKTMD